MDINTIELNKDSVLAVWPNLSTDEKIQLFKKIGMTRDKELTIEIFKVMGQSFIPELTALPSFKALQQKEADNEAMGKGARVKLMYSYRENDDIGTSFEAKPSEYKNFDSMAKAIEFSDSFAESCLRDENDECYYLDDNGRKVYISLAECWIDEEIDDEGFVRIIGEE